ncbi:MAG: thiamine-phosphate kinase [Rhodospirillaceae bacterium]|nr:thiamine-phosphate kinase [Rhodospirillaceae bacterium]MCY4065337.1 thiamine-phosphate kinase [Rhodospirillaceae bacterium]
MTARSARSGEFDLIARYFAPLATSRSGAFGLTDDAALFGVSDGADRIVTTDALVEGTHFRPDDPPDRVAQKALRVNLSDLAAMGATPEVYTLALRIPEDRNDEWVAALARGLAADQARYDVTLIGGDTVGGAGPAMLAVTAIGRLAHGPPLRRGGAAAGDDVWVTGTIGDGGLGLQVCRGEATGLDAAQRRFAVDRYRLPEPRVELGPALVGTATACLDVSDGLVADLGHLARASGLAAEILLADVPRSDAAEASSFPETERIVAGDDYELAFTAPPDRRDAVRGTARKTETPVTRIGRMRPGSGIQVLDRDGAPVPVARTGWRHR